MRKFIRNDYTLINRLERLSQKYLNLHNECSTFNKKSINYFRMYVRTQRTIEDIKEDMRLNALQKINDGCNWKKEYDCIFSK